MTHPLTPREKPLEDLLRQAVETMKSWTPEQREAHFEAQKKAWVAAEMAFGDEGTRIVTPITALASGSGDQLSGNPGILKSGSGDHEELIGVLRADRLPECSFDDGKTWELDGVGVAETFSRAADALEAILAENAALRAMVENAADGSMRQTDKLLAMHTRATEAERKLAEAVGLLKVASVMFHPGSTVGQDIRTFLSKEAERG